MDTDALRGAKSTASPTCCLEISAALAAAEAGAHHSQREAAQLKSDLHDRDEQLSELARQFNILRRKYAHLKDIHTELLWDYLPRSVDEFRSLQVHAGACALVESESETNVNAIELQHTLGSGRFGAVRLGRLANHSNGSVEELALKAVSKTRIRSLTSFRNLANEIACLRHLSAVKSKAAGSPESSAAIGLNHIVTLHSASISGTAVYLAQTLGGSDLFTLVSLYCGDLGRRLPLCMVEVITRGLLAAIAAVHSNGWCHRDIKPENVLIGADADTIASMHSAEDAAAKIHVRLCDFGVCAPLPRDKVAAQLTQFCGSPGFIAPEIAGTRNGGQAEASMDPVDAFEEESPPQGTYEGTAADVFSAGATMLEMLLGRSRFSRVWAPAYQNFAVRGQCSLTRSLRNAIDAVSATLRADADAEERLVAATTDAALDGSAAASGGGSTLQRLTALALACVDTDPHRRPTSDAIVADLMRPASPTPPQQKSGSGSRPGLRSRHFSRRHEFAAADLHGDDNGGICSDSRRALCAPLEPLPKPVLMPAIF